MRVSRTLLGHHRNFSLRPEKVNTERTAFMKKVITLMTKAITAANLSRKFESFSDRLSFGFDDIQRQRTNWRKTSSTAIHQSGLWISCGMLVVFGFRLYQEASWLSHTRISHLVLIDQIEDKEQEGVKPQNAAPVTFLNGSRQDLGTSVIKARATTDLTVGKTRQPAKLVFNLPHPKCFCDLRRMDSIVGKSLR